MSDATLVRSWPEEEGRLLRVRLAAPPGNVLDLHAIEQLAAAFTDPVEQLVAVLIDHEGPHFSYGSSIPEHLPDRIGETLPPFHDLFRQLAAFPVTLSCAVDGLCLGGGLELASFCDVLFVGRNAELGQPEVRLGVFAPVASLVLPERIGDAAARELLLSGRTIGAAEARALGLARVESESAGEAALEWIREHLLPRSPSSMRHAVRAARAPFLSRFLPALDDMERLYLDELMATPDAEEGLRAFLEKRPPRWARG